jgi:hypothetical protein
VQVRQHARRARQHRVGRGRRRLCSTRGCPARTPRGKRAQNQPRRPRHASATPAE